jgi:AcrR family transcriptional regulator
MARDLSIDTHPPAATVTGRDTRSEILDVAMELFTSQGFDGTSLRQISERLGITKAALYYYFPGKDDMMRALVAPMADAVSALLERLEAARDLREWADALEWVIGMVFEHVAFFRLLERNRHAVQQLHESFHELDDHLQMHERVEAAVHAAASSIEEEIRMFAALGAVTAFDDWAPRLLADGPPDVIERELSAAVRAILGVPAP